ncbi:MAG: DNA mismatch repair endonuclease MutL [Thermoguttaceae bacterium]|nr:DNA mismatch repair endonuclease MutL [Thermoguttaceae bacterium]
MPEIRELSKSMINKIAAGEVVERPANVVKELVENSVDAGAKRIEIVVEKSGSDLIKIVDDGCGIAAEQLVLALSPHSTSKISEADDLFRIHTLGFRGEALASIAEVSQLVLSSRTADAEAGAQIRSDGGVFDEIVPCGRPVGTTVEARNIFFNVPARRKFLKSPTTEFGHISEAVVRIALPRPDVHFVLKHNGRTVYDLPATSDRKERIGRVFGADVATRLVEIESEYKNVKVTGFVGLPDLSRGSQSLQYIFLNGRHIRDRALQHALTEAYRGLLVSGRHPVAFLNIATPPDFVDVNVHPSKLEVRFVDGQAIYASVLGAIRDKFLRSDLTSRPNDAELDAAARRTQTAFAKNAAQERSSSSESTNRPTPSALSAGSTSAAEPNAEVRELRFVPDVDSRDPIAALDESVAEERRRDVLGWLTGKSKSNAARSSEPAKTPGESRSQDAANSPTPSRFDSLQPPKSPKSPNSSASDVIAAANAALDEAAALDATSVDAFPQRRPTPPTVNLGIGGASEFRKFPPLASSLSARGDATKTPERSEPTFKPGTFGGTRDFNATGADQALKSPNSPDLSPQPNADSPDAEPSKSAQPQFFNAKELADPVATAATLRERVAANNAGRFRPNVPLENQVAYNAAGKPVVQICRRYLAMEAKGGLAVVDQHALHERILYERLKANFSAGKLDAQRLLVPEVVDLTPTEHPVALENRELFANLGILVDDFGGSSVVVNGYPAILRAASPSEIFLAALATLQRNRGKLERADLLDESLKQMACKAAIKAGDSLRPDAIVELIAAAEEELQSHHCPHGRPSTLVFSVQEIDKLFKRQ